MSKKAHLKNSKTLLLVEKTAMRNAQGGEQYKCFSILFPNCQTFLESFRKHEKHLGNSISATMCL